MGKYYVYILCNNRNLMFYTGLTDDLIGRNAEHKMGVYHGYTRKYHIHKLVYYEIHNDYESAAHREKLIKKWKKEYKFNVINAMNPEWNDLFYTLIKGDPATSAGL